MRSYLILASVVLSLSACTSRNTENPDNLPKDISLKPENNHSQQQDREMLSVMIKEIEDQIAEVQCIDSSQWKFTPIGAKPCGGPSSYIAYPTELESELLPKIETFTQMQSAFNKKYQLMSDCMLVQPPTGIECVDGKAVLKKDL